MSIMSDLNLNLMSAANPQLHFAMTGDLGGRKKVSRRKTDLFGRGCHGNGDAGNSASTELRGYFDVGAVGLVNSIITTMLTKLMKAYFKH